MTVSDQAYIEIIDLLARGSTPAEIISFRPSLSIQRRVRSLLRSCKTRELTPVEAADLRRFGEIEHLMQLVKARARFFLEGQR